MVDIRWNHLHAHRVILSASFLSTAVGGQARTNLLCSGGQSGFEKWEVEPAALPATSIIGKPNKMRMNSGLGSSLV